MKLYDVIKKEDMEQGTPLKEIPTRTEPRRHRRNPRVPLLRKILVIGGAIVFIAIVYVVGMKVARVTVILTERKVPFTLDNVEFEVVPEGAATEGRLSFQTMAVPTEVSRQVYGWEVEPSTGIASGKVVFFNEYSTSTQTVKAKTKLTAANGKTYQTTESVSVPGYTLKNKIKTAGTSVATPVTATAAGPTYNTDGTSFTVAGWTGSKAKQFYAQSAGTIDGGEDGIVHKVSSSNQGDVVATLQSDLIERLKRETRAQVPDTLIAFPDMQVTSIDNSSIQLKGEGVKFPASIKGTMVTYLLPRDLLETAIANHVLADHPYAQVSIPTLEDLTVTPITALPTDPKDIPDTIEISISGEGTIIAKAPLDVIRQSLIGTPKRTFAALLGTVPEVDSARYHFYPFWAPFFPQKDSRITIEVR